MAIKFQTQESHMQIRQRSFIASILVASLALSPLAEAKRVGGGKSYGMSRTQSSSQTYNQPSSYPSNSTYSAPAQRSGSGVGKMVAAGVAGAAIGAVAANALANDHDAAKTQDATATDTNAAKPESKGGFGWLWIAILAIGGFLLFRRFSTQKVKAANPYAPNSGQNPFSQSNTATTRNVSSTGADNTNIFGQTVGTTSGAGAAYSNSGNQLPDGTEPAAFLRQARAKFLHLQSMNSSSNIEEVRRYFTPEMYQAIREDIQNNIDLAEFPQLNAQLVETATENGQYIASVRFSGLVSETLNAAAVPFTETWHFVKMINGGDWLVAGIQQG